MPPGGRRSDGQELWSRVEAQGSITRLRLTISTISTTLSSTLSSTSLSTHVPVSPVPSCMSTRLSVMMGSSLPVNGCLHCFP